MFFKEKNLSFHRAVDILASSFAFNFPLHPYDEFMPPAVIPYPQIDPFMFRIGSKGLSWYAFAYMVTFVSGYFILRYRYRKGLIHFEKKEDVGLLITYLFYGVILGARLFYVLFYNPLYYLENPLEIPAIWLGGMSFHGGLVCGFLAMVIFSKRHRVSLWQMADSVGLVAPIGLCLGRLANFINGELFGRPTDVAWAMVFPGGGPEPRHPSQLYESFFGGSCTFSFNVVGSQTPKKGRGGSRDRSYRLQRDALYRGVFPAAGPSTGDCFRSLFHGADPLLCHDTRRRKRFSFSTKEIPTCSQFVVKKTPLHQR